jgi:hypothetical protein
MTHPELVVGPIATLVAGFAAVRSWCYWRRPRLNPDQFRLACEMTGVAVGFLAAVVGGAALWCVPGLTPKSFGDHLMYFPFPGMIAGGFFGHVVGRVIARARRRSPGPDPDYADDSHGNPVAYPSVPRGNADDP